MRNPRPVALSRAATEVLAIVAYPQPIARATIELIRVSASDSALDRLLQRGLVAHGQHHLFVTTRGFLDYAGSERSRRSATTPRLDKQDLGGLSHRP
ncbi:MAG: SMC-Scp complex subunit ScpB [Chloroflexota bacterium]|nr:SMC-Scp complex subunit ScpB [Chloroflexota bacterium]